MGVPKPMRAELNVGGAQFFTAAESDIGPIVERQREEVGIDAVRGIHLQNVAR